MKDRLICGFVVASLLVTMSVLFSAVAYYGILLLFWTANNVGTLPLAVAVGVVNAIHLLIKIWKHS